MARTLRDRSKLLELLEKNPSISYACEKVGVSRSTFYRWMKSNAEFRRKVERYREISRERWNDLAEAVLMKQVQKGDMRAVQYYLGHNHPQYMSKAIDNLEAVRKQAIQDYQERNTLSPQDEKRIITALINIGAIQPDSDKKE